MSNTHVYGYLELALSLAELFEKAMEERERERDGYLEGLAILYQKNQ